VVEIAEASKIATWVWGCPVAGVAAPASRSEP
jgi:hypothetical protein